MTKENTIYEEMENDIYNANLDETEKNKLLKNLFQLKEKKYKKKQPSIGTILFEKSRKWEIL